MLRHLLQLAGISAVVLTMAACQPMSKNPLIDPNEADRDTRLYGTWISAPGKADEDRQYSVMHIGPAPMPLAVGAEEPEAGLLQAWYTTHNQRTSEVGNPVGFFFVTSQIGATWVASISEGVDFTFGHAAREDMSQMKRITDTDKRFWFLRYEVDEDTLQVWGVPKLEVIDQAIRDNVLHGTVQRNDRGRPTTIELVDSTEVLNKYFVDNWQKLFDEDPALVYTRVKVPDAR